MNDFCTQFHYALLTEFDDTKAQKFAIDFANRTGSFEQVKKEIIQWVMDVFKPHIYPITTQDAPVFTLYAADTPDSFIDLFSNKVVPSFRDRFN